MQDCKSYGTLPFAGVARLAFIAVQFLQSFVDLDIINEDEYHKFMNSLNTINKQMNSDLREFTKGLKSKEEFIKQYGHIRPGTYDILSERYNEENSYYPKNY